MKKILLLVVAFIAAVLFIRFFVAPPIDISPETVLEKEMVEDVHTESESGFMLQSAMFLSEDMIDPLYTCDGENISPEMTLINPPDQAVSYALIIDDPDAPSGSFIHWVLFNIDRNTEKINNADVPEGAVVGQNSTGESRYVGPCPPKGTHRYFFMLYALDTTLGLDGKATAQDVQEAMKGHVIEKTTLIGRYTRDK